MNRAELFRQSTIAKIGRRTKSLQCSLQACKVISKYSHRCSDSVDNNAPHKAVSTHMPMMKILLKGGIAGRGAEGMTVLVLQRDASGPNALSNVKMTGMDIDTIYSSWRYDDYPT